MSKGKFLLVMLALAFLQGTLLPPVFLSGIFIYFYSLAEKQKAYPPVFLSGLIFDIVQPAPLGLNTSIFLLFSFAVIVLSGRLPIRHPLTVAFFILLFNLVRSKILFSAFPFLPAVFAALLAVLLMGRLGEDIRGGIKLR